MNPPKIIIIIIMTIITTMTTTQNILINTLETVQKFNRILDLILDTIVIKTCPMRQVTSAMIDTLAWTRNN